MDYQRAVTGNCRTDGKERLRQILVTVSKISQRAAQRLLFELFTFLYVTFLLFFLVERIYLLTFAHK
jgi:hypothetical protein